jgi:hypothetical protein
VLLHAQRQTWSTEYIMSSHNTWLPSSFQTAFLFSSLGFRIAQLLAPRRPLKPVRRERKTIGAQVRFIWYAVLVILFLSRSPDCECLDDKFPFPLCRICQWQTFVFLSMSCEVLIFPWELHSLKPRKWNLVHSFFHPQIISKTASFFCLLCSAQALDPRASARPVEASTAASSMFTTSSMHAGNAPQSRPAGARTNPLGEVGGGSRSVSPRLEKHPFYRHHSVYLLLLFSQWFDRLSKLSFKGISFGPAWLTVLIRVGMKN